MKSVKDIPDDVVTLFWENEIKGSEILALNENGLKMIGVERVGIICLLMKEIKQLEEASQDKGLFWQDLGLSPSKEPPLSWPD